ncbi:MAG: hypothetical protein AAFP98_12285 [Pseudomonadota bacterium]
MAKLFPDRLIMAALHRLFIVVPPDVLCGDEGVIAVDGLSPFQKGGTRQVGCAGAVT